MATTESASTSARGASEGLADPQLLAEWFAVGWSREVAADSTLARRVMARDVVLWRSNDGELHCWLDLCVHRGAKLSLGSIQKHTGRDGNGAGDCLVCPYHGWSYAESGQCVAIPAHPGLTPPAKARAQTFLVRERYGVIWVCFGDTSAELPAFPIAEEDGFRALLAGPYRFRALGPRLIENLLDVAHLGIVHAGLLGDPAQSEIEDYEVETGARGPEAKEIRVWQPNPDGTGAGAHVAYHYEVLGPLTAGFVKLGGQENSEKRFGILAQVMPVDCEFSEMRLVMAMNYGQEIPDEELIAFQDRVTEQDRVIVESQRPELLPLDLQAELHLRSDRMAIAYRKWLREIGFTYGVA
ncbi:MAG TPA: aromatic ring-hydroxylating dioxygenase subunit alpha [Acidobacteriaceae bacterium]|jgi:phenylpropionate dioxygenase-like ring-hydroxylating dioxygenase large terminal subunit|nr:aromatic ring-hydroxylating dioxygenase subunit alpha [Acidobacteriaceae bacterium]